MNLEIKTKNNKIFAPLLNKCSVNKPEEKVRQEYLCRLINNYKFTLAQMQQEVEVNNSQRVQGQVMADIVIWKNKKKDKLENINSVIVVECKEEHITIQEEDYF